LPVLSATRVRVRSYRYYPWFMVQTARIFHQACRSEGNLAVRFLRDRSRTFWTLTSWSSEGDLKRFLGSGVHRSAMHRMHDWCDEAAAVRWTDASAEPPSWGDTYLRLQRDGVPSHVLHPSPSHERFEVRPPWVSFVNQMKLR
jgi:hypothetical protein